jgi:signal transduction histidine kinase/phage shock protein PspC (stress-responsive transcriptional regulator)
VSPSENVPGNSPSELRGTRAAPDGDPVLPGVQVPSQTPPNRSERPGLVRPERGRLLGGVASGLAAHLGTGTLAVRAAFVALAVLGGSGIVLYLWLWALVPDGATGTAWAGEMGRYPGIRPTGSPRAAGSTGGTGTVDGTGGTGAGGCAPGASRSRDILLGLLLLLMGLVFLGLRAGWGDVPGLFPLLVVGCGAIIAFSQLDEVERSRLTTRTRTGTRSAVLRVAAGAALVVIGAVLLAVQGSGVVQAARILVAVLAVLAGLGLVLAPWGLRMWRSLDAERAALARQTARADIAAHLHDSVLQTLALVQKHSGDPTAVARLARAQERELREYLYGPPDLLEATLAKEVRSAAAQIEDLHGVAVDVVVVGDRDLDERGAALVAALREAMLNAVRHAGAPVQVYAECGPDRVDAFVRDRGPGFDPEAVPPDRLGVRRSIIGRMQRYGGTARVRTALGEGTEVRLELPGARTVDPRESAGRGNGANTPDRPDTGHRTPDSGSEDG